MIELIGYIESLVKKGGPEPTEYDQLSGWFQNVGEKLRSGQITRAQITEMWPVFGEAFSMDTLQGFVVSKPHGYAGDFEIIDRIHTEWMSPNQDLIKWDKFFHWQRASIAVRNRKQYFKQLLREIDNSGTSPTSILNVGSGPCRDVCEYLEEYPSTRISFECIDMDENAINYASRLFTSPKVRFYCQNAFSFKPNNEYHLVWSAGLFDYFDDGQFVLLFRTLYEMLPPDGEIIVGNFSEQNPSRDYMEFAEWYIYHRSEDDLRSLAEAAGCRPELISVDKEPTGVNLFLRVRKS